MEFTDSQKDFILNSLTTEITKQNDLVKKNKINKSVELCVQKIQELEALRGLLHE